MSHNLTFSVVIPTYNRVEFLKRALSSVWTQRCTDYEVIVVDDGSNDGTWEYLRGLAGKVRVLRQSNAGPGAARNAGAKAARGDYLSFLDSDDLWFPWTLDAFARAIQKHGRPYIIGGNYIEFADEAQPLEVQEQWCQSVWFPDFLASSHFPYFVGSGTCALRRDAFNAASFLEDRLNGEDHDFILQLGTVPGFVRILSPITLAWRRHPASETGDFASSVSGALRLVVRERSGAYPGGSQRSRERHRILARYVRSVTIACIRSGAMKRGWDLYRLTFGWNLSLGHWAYVAAFPVLTVLTVLSHLKTGYARAGK
jgi:glycosyltransferase involved in cell wall biosynthesis